MYFVYVIQSLDDSERFYLGQTKDIKKRLEQHNEGMNTSTRNSKWRVVYYEAYITRAYAVKRERSLKRNARMRQFLKQRIRDSIG